MIACVRLFTNELRSNCDGQTDRHVSLTHGQEIIDMTSNCSSSRSFCQQSPCMVHQKNGRHNQQSISRFVFINSPPITHDKVHYLYLYDVIAPNMKTCIIILTTFINILFTDTLHFVLKTSKQSILHLNFVSKTT